MLFTSCVTLGKLLNRSVPQHQQSDNANTTILRGFINSPGLKTSKMLTVVPVKETILNECQPALSHPNVFSRNKIVSTMHCPKLKQWPCLLTFRNTLLYLAGFKFYHLVERLPWRPVSITWQALGGLLVFIILTVPAPGTAQLTKCYLTWERASATLLPGKQKWSSKASSQHGISFGDVSLVC